MHTRGPVRFGQYPGTGNHRTKHGKPMPGSHPATQAKYDRLSPTVRFMRKMNSNMVPKKVHVK